MNLHGIVSNAIGALNPQQSITVMQSTGYTTAADGTQVPSYFVIPATGQVQALTGSDIMKLNGLNIQGVTQKAYLTGDFEGVFRVLGKGGDLLKFGGQTYLVTAVLERWPDWVCVGITMQLDGQ
jgi:hypothetical protein